MCLRLVFVVSVSCLSVVEMGIVVSLNSSGLWVVRWV